MRINKTCVILLAVILAIGFSFLAFAENEKTVSVIDKNGSVVKTYEMTEEMQKTNIRPAVQKALDYIRDNGSPNNIMTVKIEKGEYSVTESMAVFSNTVLDFSGSTLVRNGIQTVIRFGRGGEIASGYDTYQNITIKNLTVNANRTGTATCIVFAHAQNVLIDNVTLTNSLNVAHLLAFAACKDVRIINSVFSNSDFTGESNGSNYEAIQIDVLKEKYFPAYGAYDETPSQNVEISSCTFKNVRRGCGTHTSIAGHYFNNFKINNNTFDGIEGYAIRTANYRNSEIKNNTITNSGCGILVSDVANVSYSNSFAGFEGAVLNNDCNIKITGNKISLVNTPYYFNNPFGIRLCGEVVNNHTDEDGNVLNGDFRLNNIEVSNNEIVSNVTDKAVTGIYLKGSAGSSKDKDSTFTVYNNKVVFNAQSSAGNIGMSFLESSGTCVYGNEFISNNNSMNNGINVSSCNDVSILSNRVAGTLEEGVKLSNTKNTDVKDNIIYDTLKNTINVYTNSSKINVSGNILDYTGGYAVCVRNSSDITVFCNSISDQAKRLTGAIYVDASSNSFVESNSVNSSSGFGVMISKANNVKVISNTVKSSVSSGVRCREASKCEIDSNSISNADANGIYVYSSSSDITVSKNTVTDSKGYAISAASSTKVNIASNKVYDNAEKLSAAINLDSTKESGVKSNTVYSSNSVGIRCVKSTDCEISSNKVSNTGSNGIYVYSSSSDITVSKNTVTDSKGYAISAASSTKVNIASNKVYDKAEKLSAAINLDSTKESGVKSNIVYSSNSVGIRCVKSTDCEILSNKVSNTGSNGIYVYSSSSDITVSKNTVTDSKGYAISTASSTKVNISSNKVYDKAEKLSAAINLDSIKESSVKSNTVYSSNGCAVRTVKSSNCIIEFNTVSSAQKNGISVYSSSSGIVISSNKISAVKGYGVYAKDSKNIEISKNSFEDKIKKLTAAIYADNVKTSKILSNKVVSCAGKGIRLSAGSSATVKSNSITGCASDGIYAQKVKTLNVSSNSVKTAKGTGILISSGVTGASITSNTVDGAKNGIYSKDASLTGISSNKIYGAKENGIWLTGKADCKKVGSNFIYCASKYAIYLNSAACATEIYKNKIDLSSSKASAVYIGDKSTCEKINSNEINQKKEKKSKKLSAKCASGIIIKSTSAKTKQISSNKISSCKSYGIYTAKLKVKPKIEKNTVASCTYGIAYKSASLKSNKITKSGKKSTVKL